MDTLYIGDIPSEYHFAIFNNGYIDLYNTNVLHNNTYTRYRVFTNVNGFYYDISSVNVGNYTTTYTTDINVSNEVVYRQDFHIILFMTLCFTFIGIWLFNLVTSLIRKGRCVRRFILMYMFFWFFKQLFYIFKRFTKHTLLLLFLFFIVFLFLRSKVFASTSITSNAPNWTPTTITIPDLSTIPSSVQNYIPNGYIIQNLNWESPTKYRMIIKVNNNATFWHKSGNTADKFSGTGDFVTLTINSNSNTWNVTPQFVSTSSSFTWGNSPFLFSTIYTDSNRTNVYFNYVPPVINPFIENSLTDIQNFSFDTLDINGGTIIQPEDSIDLLVTYRDNLAPNIPSYREEYTIINNETSKTIDGSTVIYHIPKSAIASPVIIRNGYYFYFTIVVRHSIERWNTNTCL